MGFKFQCLCDLLSSLENNRILKAATESRNTDPDARIVSRWFTQNGKRLRNTGTDQLAVLSCLFPEKRTDRVYMLQDVSLSRVIGRCLLLGSSRREELERWRLSGGADLGQCVENVMKQAENQIMAGQEVTVEEIDAVLTQIASRSKFSGPRVRRQRAAVDVEEALSPIYRRLSSRDAKWLTRMILKSYYPVVVPERLALRSFHFLLPRLLLFQDTLEAALNMLRTEPLVRFPAHPEPGQALDLGAIALRHLSPVIGVKIGRPDYYKARSIKHCCQMIGGRRMSIEKKYDGEYCQIHIDLSSQNNCIQIFSKSGKDSTEDRAGINPVLKESLRLQTSECRFSRRCILEGEIVVWSDAQRKIMDFHNLRKFISRSGTFIGTQNDSQPQLDEHLMIVFFDVLLLDDDVCLRKPHRERRLLLKELVKAINGRADIAEQRVLDFSHRSSQSRLEGLFAKGIAERWEGFVLKGCEDPYFTFFGETNNSRGRWIKLKKDYIPGLGDTVDLTIIGGSYNSREAVGLKELHRKILWTHFFVACLINKGSVLQSKIRPRFRVIDVIDRNGISPQNMQILNQIGEFSACDANSDHGFDIEFGHAGVPCMSTVYKKPFVVEMLGGGFEKPSGARYFTLRFPRILKIHSDRSFEEAASFTELQVLADDARAIPSEELVEEEHEWSKRLKLGDGSSEYIVDRSQSRSQSVVSTTTSSSQTASYLDGGAQVTLRNPGQSRGAFSRITQFQQRMVHQPTTHIPIYVDTSMSSSPSSDTCDCSDNLLASNENFSSNQSSRQRKDSAATTSDMDSKPATLAIRLANERENQGITNEINTLASSDSGKQSKTAEPPRTNFQPKTKSISKNHTLKSPLLTTPIYFANDLNRNDNALILANTLATTSSLESFLHAIQSPPTRTHATPSVALVLLNPQQTQLGQFLLTLSQALHRQLQHQAHSEPTQSGKIFILDSAFLNLPAAADDARFCLQETWSSIGDEYFYACVRWTSDKFSDTVHAGNKEDNKSDVRKEGPSVHISDEIPCTPMSEAGQTRRRTVRIAKLADSRSSAIPDPCPSFPGEGEREADEPSRILISITFNREMCCLRELETLDPLVRSC